MCRFRVGDGGLHERRELAAEQQRIDEDAQSRHLDVDDPPGKERLDVVERNPQLFQEVHRVLIFGHGQVTAWLWRCRSPISRPCTARYRATSPCRTTVRYDPALEQLRRHHRGWRLRWYRARDAADRGGA